MRLALSACSPERTLNVCDATPLTSGLRQSDAPQARVRAAGDAGTLATKLSLTADNPIADAAFGIDNTFAGRAVAEGVLLPYTPAALPASAAGV